jgi:hypothetical protein
VDGARGQRRRDRRELLVATKVTFAATPPNVIVVGSVKFVPATVIGVPPCAGPDAGEMEKMIRCENSDVLPAGSVAVAEIRVPAGVATGKVTSKAATPDASVVTCVVPMNVSPSRKSRGKSRHEPLAKNSTSKVVEAAPL